VIGLFVALGLFVVIALIAMAGARWEDRGSADGDSWRRLHAETCRKPKISLLGFSARGACAGGDHLGDQLVLVGRAHHQARRDEEAEGRQLAVSHPGPSGCGAPRLQPICATGRSCAPPAANRSRPDATPGGSTEPCPCVKGRAPRPSPAFSVSPSECWLPAAACTHLACVLCGPRQAGTSATNHRRASKTSRSVAAAPRARRPAVQGPPCERAPRVGPAGPESRKLQGGLVVIEPCVTPGCA
jgi:hypothetical protein